MIFDSMIRHARRLVALVGLTTVLAATAATPRVGMLTLPPVAPDGQVTVFYPSDADESAVQRGPFALQLAVDAPPAAGNRRLIVLSHGSGGSPWVHADIARALVQAGYVVAAPWHRGDNTRDAGRPGPDSWALRPGELSRAIDAVGREPRLAPLVELDRVGVYGMSAGGHTALSMAGGVWSRGGFKRHCDENIAEDFNSCVGLITQLRGNALDGVKIAVARWVIDWTFDDDAPQAHRDPRVAAVVAAVPTAADFDMASFASPGVPIALLTSGRDAWLTPKFHAERVLAACRRCERLFDLPNGGHGAWLSPPPPRLDGLAGRLLNDPPGFDRSVLPAADRAVVAFFAKHLLSPAPIAVAQRGGGRLR
jgi:predicted dienelactone hydrolase